MTTPKPRKPRPKKPKGYRMQKVRLGPERKEAWTCTPTDPAYDGIVAYGSSQSEAYTEMRRMKTMMDATRRKKTVTDATKAKLPRPKRNAPPHGTPAVPPTPPPCVDYRNTTANLAPVTRVTYAPIRVLKQQWTEYPSSTPRPTPPSPFARAHALMLRLSAAWDCLAARLV